MSLDTTPAPHRGGTTATHAIAPEFSWRQRTARPRVGRVAKVAARRSDGSLICLSDLPGPGLRWTRLRKQAVVDCVDHGLIGTEAIYRRYGLSAPELDEWRQTVDQGGRVPRVWPHRPRSRRGGVVRDGELEVDLDGEALRIGGRGVSVAPSEWVILRALVEAEGAVVSNSMLMGALYGNPEAAAGPKIADVLICRLRRKFAAEAGRIQSVWGRGYRLSL